jgi:putative transposase
MEPPSMTPGRPIGTATSIAPEWPVWQADEPFQLRGARGYMAISSGSITDEMIQKYIEEQEGEIVEDGRFQIDSSL